MFFANPRFFFTVVSIFFGMLYIVLTPPFQSPDEAHHFYRVAHMANGNMMGVQTVDKRSGGMIPTSLPVFAEKFRYMRNEYTSKTSIESMLQTTNIPLESSTVAFQDFANVAIYAPFPYLVPAVGTGVAGAFNLPPFYLFYLSRLLSFFIWFLLVRKAIELMPFHQWTFTFLALLPSSLFINTSINADVLTNGLSFLLLAFLLKLIYEENYSISRKRQLLLVLISLLISINKIIYLPLVLLAFLIPKEKFLQKKASRFFAISLLSINLLAVLGWYFYLEGAFISYDDYHPVYRIGQQLNEGVNPSAQLAFIFSHPIEFIKITTTSYLKGIPSTMMHYFGKFGWEKNYLPIWTIILLMGTVLLSAFTEKSTLRIRLSIKHRFSFIGIALMMMGGFTVLMYMLWNPVASPVITNLSGRYFIPIFPLFFLAAQQYRFTLLKQNQLILLLQGVSIIGLSIGGYSILLRYYL